MSKRYERNMMTLTLEENEKFKDFKVFVAGCGGLGGYLIEELGRLGIGHITAVDGDVFEESNLNRQLLAETDNLGTGKASAAKDRMARVNPEVELTPIREWITESNCKVLAQGHQIALDALDSIPSRRILEQACEELGIPLVHGAIAGWYGQVTTIFPGDRTLEHLYPDQGEKGAEVELGNPSFTPAVIASIQVAEAVKVLLNKPGVLRGKLLSIDLLEQEYDVFQVI